MCWILSRLAARGATARVGRCRCGNGSAEQVRTAATAGRRGQGRQAFHRSPQDQTVTRSESTPMNGHALRAAERGVTGPDSATTPRAWGPTGSTATAPSCLIAATTPSRSACVITTRIPGRPSAASATGRGQLTSRGGRLVHVDGHVGRSPATGADALEQLADRRLAGAAAEIVERLLDGHLVGALGGDSTDAAERVVGSIAGRPDHQRQETLALARRPARPGLPPRPSRP